MSLYVKQAQNGGTSKTLPILDITPGGRGWPTSCSDRFTPWKETSLSS